MKKYIIGALIGSALTISATAGAAAVKQYILTDASYPIVVNGKEYKDAAAPILNYEGSTYVPLAKLGDLTGVNYKWNDEAKRVEIVTSGQPVAGSDKPLKEEVVYEHDIHPEAAGSVTGGTPSGGTLKPDTKIIEPKGWIQENGEFVLYAYDKDNNFKGKFTDSQNAELAIAKIEKRKELPPTINKGFLSLGDLSKIYNDADLKWEGSTLIFKSNPIYLKEEEYFRLALPSDWKNAKNGIFEANGILISDYIVNNGIADSWADEKSLKSEVGVTYSFCNLEKSLRNFCLYKPYQTKENGFGKSDKFFESEWPESWDKSDNQKEISLNGVRVKRENKINYFFVEDLIKLGAFDPNDYISHSLYFHIPDLTKEHILTK